VTGPAYTRAGSPEPPPLPVASSSDREPLGSAGLVNQGTTGTVDQVGPAYGDIATATAAAAMAKREADQAVISK